MRNWIVTGIVAGLAAVVLSLLYLIHLQEVIFHFYRTYQAPIS